jgi:hypothetical protein
MPRQVTKYIDFCFVKIEPYTDAGRVVTDAL